MRGTLGKTGLALFSLLALLLLASTSPAASDFSQPEASGWFGSPVEVKGELSLESRYRFSGQFDTNRALYDMKLKQAWEDPQADFTAEVWAWKNFSAENYGMSPDQVAPRQLKLNYWRGNLNLTAGLQELSWGETFGYQPVDLVNARNYRDFALLDHARNKIPVYALKGYYDAGRVKLEAVVNPRGETNVLPTRLGGLPVTNTTRETQWGLHPELGAKASLVFSDANLDLFAYRHLNRFPVFLALPVAGTGPQLAAQYEPVTSLGSSFSRGFESIVLRGDLVYTPDHPVGNASFMSIGHRDAFHAVAGLDWSPTELVEGMTLALQGQVDRYPVAVDRVSYGVSVLARKSLWREKLELDAQGFQGLTYNDHWLQASTRLRLGDVRCALLAEALSPDATSPFAFLGDFQRIGTEVGYSF